MVLDPSIVENAIRLTQPDGQTTVAILDNAYNAVVSEQLLDDNGGAETLTFSLPIGDPKIGLIHNEMCIRVTHVTHDPALTPFQVTSIDSVYNIRKPQAGYDDQGNKVFTVYCEALWYNLGTDDVLTVTPAVPTALAAMTAILAATPWTIGVIGVSAPAGGVAWGTADLLTPLAALRSLPAIFGGELVFDNVNRQVSLLPRRGDQTPHIMYIRGGNMAHDIRTIDTTLLTTRVHPIGSNGLDITSVNGGVTYIEDYSYFDGLGIPRQRRAQAITNEQISDPVALLAWAQNQLAIMAKPIYSYDVGVSLLTGVTGAVPRLGDLVRVVDPTLTLDTYARVSAREYNVIRPQDSVLTVDTAAYTLATPSGGGTGLATGSNGTDFTIPDPPVGPLVLEFGSGVDQNGNWNTYGVAVWGAPTANTDGTPISDFDHYDVEILLPTSTTWTPVGATSATSVNFGYIPSNQTINVRVRTVDHSYNKSAWLTGSALVPLPTPFYLPPDTPVLDASTLPLCIQVIWDGLDNNGVPYPPDVDTIQIHMIQGIGAFTVSASTLVASVTITGQAGDGGGFVMPVTGLTPGLPYTIEMVAVGRLGVTSDPSVPVTATVQPVGPTVLAYNGDQNNIVPDGSFETIGGQARLMADVSWSSAWSFITPATAPAPYGGTAINHGQFALMGTGGNLTGNDRQLILVNAGTTADEKVWAKIRYYNTTTGGTCTMGIVAYDANNVVLDTTTVTLPPTTGYQLQSLTYTLPAACTTYSFFVDMDLNVSAGYLFVDAVELRSVIGTAIIDQLAVHDAQIYDANISKLSAGSLQADMTISARIKTADTGSRVEINSGGLFAYSGSTQTVAIRNDGSASFTGTIVGSDIQGSTIEGATITGAVIQTALSGRRVVIDPSSTGLMEFYGGSVNEAGPALINASAISLQPVLTISSPSGVGYGGQSQIQLFPDQGAGDYVAVVTHNQTTGGTGSILFYGNISQNAGTAPWSRGPTTITAGTWSDTTDASGYVFVTHGLGHTPGSVLITGLSPNGGTNIASTAMADSFNSSTFRVRVFDSIANSVFASKAVTFSYLATT